MTHHKWGRFPPSLLLLLPPLPAAEVLRCSRLVNMATAGATGDDLRKELTCAICLDFFKDPVILKCGHNFCRFCICMHWDENGGDYGYQCPQCRTVSLWTLSVFSTMFFFFFRKFISAHLRQISPWIVCRWMYSLLTSLWTVFDKMTLATQCILWLTLL